MSNFLDEAGIVNLLPRPNVVTQGPTRAPTQAPLSAQLQTAAALTKAPVPTTKTNIVPVATPGPIKSTPMPLQRYEGPQDDLIFDPDELAGDARPGAGYALPGTAVKSGPTASMMPQMKADTSGQQLAAGNVSTAATAGTSQSTTQGNRVAATTIDLADEDAPDDQETGGFMKSYGKWIVIIALIIATILLLLAFYGLPTGMSGGGGGRGGMQGDPYGISSGGIASGIGGAGLGGGLGGLGGVGGAGGYGGY